MKKKKKEKEIKENIHKYISKTYTFPIGKYNKITREKNIYKIIIII